jgi:hypothetical protein
MTPVHQRPLTQSGNRWALGSAAIMAQANILMSWHDYDGQLVARCFLLTFALK